MCIRDSFRGEEPPPVVAQERAAARVQRVGIVEQGDQETRVNDDACHARSPGSAAGVNGAPLPGAWAIFSPPESRYIV